MSLGQVNPGSLAFRLGQVLSLYEQAILANKLEQAAAFLDLAASYISVHLTPAEWSAYEGLPGFVYGDKRNASELYAALNNRLRHILRKGKQHGVFAKAEVELGDASGMDGGEE